MTICRFTLAVDRRKSANQQPNQPTADFINCVAFGKTAETIVQYVHKGNRFAITGHISTGSYENQQGQRVYTFEVIVDNFTFIHSRNEGSQSMNGGYSQSNGGGYGSGNNSWGNSNSASSQDSYYGGGFSSTPAYNSYQSPSASNQGANNTGFGNTNTASPFGSSSSSNDFDSSFDDSDGLDIASDDLPF